MCVGAKIELGRGENGIAFLVRTASGEAVRKELFTKATRTYEEGERAKTLIENLAELRPHIPHSWAELYSIEPTENAYLREYVKGAPVGELLPESRPAEKARFIEAYGMMLLESHMNGIVVAHHGWEDFVWDIERGTGKLVDYENAALLPRAQIPWHPSRAVRAAYAAREQLLANAKIPLDELPPITFQTDVESFARLIDEAYNGTGMRDTVHAYITAIQDAKKNVATYPQERAQALPARLRQPITALLSYPRDDSVSIDMLIEAVREP